MIVAIDARLAGGDFTGDSSYWTGLLHGLASLPDDDTRYLLFSNAEKPAAIPSGDKFEWINLPAAVNRWWSLVRFPRAARKRGADVIHTQYNLSPLAGRRGVTTIHDVSFFVGPQWFRAGDLLLLRRFVPASARRASRVITVSESSRAEIEKFIPVASGKTVVTPLARPVHIQPVDRARAMRTVERRFGLQEPFLLTVGTRWPRKNAQLAIDAARMSDYTLALTGKSGWGVENLGASSKALGYVTSEELSALYSSASLYLAPSRHEGFGLPLLEAFACGCPVMCSAGGALPEVAGDAAMIVRSWDANDWAAAIGDAMSESSNLDDLRRKGSERESQFSWGETARRTLEVYKQVATENRR